MFVFICFSASHKSMNINIFADFLPFKINIKLVKLWNLFRTFLMFWWASVIFKTIKQLYNLPLRHEELAGKHFSGAGTNIGCVE